MADTESRQIPISEAMGLAIDHQQAGRLEAAEAIYRAVLQSQPTHAGANYNLALIALQSGRAEQALPALKAAVSADPANVAYWLNLAAALAGSGDAAAARDVLLQARERGLGGKVLVDLLAQVERMVQAPRPAVVETIDASGAAPLRSLNLTHLFQLYEQGQYAQVEAQARALWPEFAQSTQLAHLLGSSLLELGRFDEAREVLATASRSGSPDALVHHLHGLALRRLERNDEAREAFERALAIDPDRVDTLLNASANAVTLREPAAARRYAQRAIALRARSADALRVAADAEAADDNYGEAIELYRRAISLDPDSADLRINLGDSLTALGRSSEAVTELEYALSLRPNDMQARLNLGNALFRLGETAAASAQYRSASELAPQRTDVQTAYLFCLLHDDTVTAQKCFEEHLRIGELIEAPRRRHRRPHENERDPARGLRLGFVSGDLRDHAVAYLIEPVWRAMRGGRHRVIAYANYPREDAVSARLKSLTDEWVRVERLGDEDLAERIRADRIDILFDLSGHTTHNRLNVFAMKPAPIQVSWLGYPGTTGLSAIDYRIMRGVPRESDPAEAFFCEKVVRLSSLAFEPVADAPQVLPLPAVAAGHITFGSFNRPGKIGNSTLDLWGEVLRAVPDSKLLIAAAGEESTQQRLAAQFEARGIAAGRLTFRPRVPLTEYLSMHNEVDIALDTIPYNGGTTTRHALWMGVPVLTLLGDTPRQRQAAAALRGAGMSDWIAESSAAYVEKARKAASDLDGLSRVRQTLRPQLVARLSGEETDLARNMDLALQTMWRRWCAGLAPESFSVPA